MLQSIEGIARDVTECLRYQHELEIIGKLSEAVRKANSRSELIAVIMDQILDLLQANGSALILKDPNTEEGVVELARGLLATVTGDRIPSGEGISGWVMNLGEAFVSDNTNADLLNQVIFMDENIHGIACVPLVTQDLIIGALMITRDKPVDAYEVRLLVAYLISR